MNNNPSGAPVGVPVPNLLASLQTLVSDLERDSRSPNTRRAYASAWGAFESWARATGVPPLPASPETVALYLAHLYGRGRKASTIEVALVAISQTHRDANLPSPRTDPRIRKVVRGIRRRPGTEQTPKAPLLAEQVERIAELTPDDARGQRDRALLSLGFATGLRTSELIGLDVTDLTFTDRGVTVRIERSKTDPTGRGRELQALARPGSPSCPVDSVRRWLVTAALVGGPLFRPIRADGKVLARRLQARAVARLVKAGAAKVGIDPSRVSGHSLRSGFATAAALAGTAEGAIIRTLGHRSALMAARYIRTASAT